jgi:hypothetical protein
LATFSVTRRWDRGMHNDQVNVHQVADELAWLAERGEQLAGGHDAPQLQVAIDDIDVVDRPALGLAAQLVDCLADGQPLVDHGDLVVIIAGRVFRVLAESEDFARSSAGRAAAARRSGRTSRIVDAIVGCMSANSSAIPSGPGLDDRDLLLVREVREHLFPQFSDRRAAGLTSVGRFQAFHEPGGASRVLPQNCAAQTLFGEHLAQLAGTRC